MSSRSRVVEAIDEMNVRVATRCLRQVTPSIEQRVNFARLFDGLDLWAIERRLTRGR